MDKDRSLIEISGEDDSLLLQQIQNNDSCSTLQLTRSSHFAHRSFASPLGPRLGLSGEGGIFNKDMETPCSSVHSNCANKENTNFNKQEVSKLSVDRQQMKRKKKGAGYNLRKSLAWDRAFFTEEGVLDPLELSIISGNYNNIGEEKLSVIHEEGRESLSGTREGSRNSGHLQVLEEKLFQELPSNAATEERRAGNTLSQKYYSPSRNHAGSSTAAKQKVLPIHRVNTSGSKQSGCPRSSTSTSLKRPSSMNMAKTASKELKFSKMAVTKPVPDALSGTVRSNLERNQIARPAINVQKNIGTKLFTTNARSARNETKSGKSSASKSFIQQPRKNVGNSKSEPHSSMNSRPRRAIKENICSQGVPSAVRPPCGQASNGSVDGAIRVGVSLPQISSNIGGKVPCTQAQTMKPSGLRMPSPSLGFFGQSKAPASQSLLQSTQRSLPKSNVPNVAKDGPRERSPSTPTIPREVADDVTAGITAAQCSSAGRFAPSSANHTSHEETESNLPPSNNRKVEDWKAPLHQRPYKQLKEQDQDKRVTEVCDDFLGVHKVNKQHGELIELLKPSVYEAQLISHEKHQSLQINAESVLQESISSTEFKKRYCENRADACLKVQVSTESELEMCHGLSRKEGSAGVDSRKFDTEDAHLHSLGGSLLVESGNDILRSLNVDNKKFMVVDDPNRQCAQSKLPSFSQQESVLGNILLPEKSDACGNELQSAPLCLMMPSAVTDYGSCTKDIAQCLPLEDKLSSPLIREPEIENCNSSSPQLRDLEIHGIEDLEQMDMAKREDAISACKDEVTIVSPVNRNLAGSELDKQHWTPNFVPAVVQAEVGALKISDIIAHECLGGKHHSISLRNHHVVYDLQSRDDINHNQQSTKMGHDDLSNTTRDSIDLPLEQAKLVKPWSQEDDKVSHNENYWRGSYEGFMFDKSRSSEESPKFNRGNSADVNPETKSFNGNGFEGADHLLRYINAEKENMEVEGFINVEKSLMEPAKSQSFEGSTSCGDNPSTFKCFVFINDVSEQNEDPRFPDPNPDASEISPSLCPTILDGAVDVDDKVDYPQPENGAMLVSAEINLNGGFDLFSQISEGQTLEAVGTCPKPIHCSSEDLVLTGKINQRQSSGSIPQDIEVTLLESNIFQQVGTNVIEMSSCDDCQPQLDLEDASCSAEDDDVPVIQKESGNEKKAGVLLMKPRPDVVPFSDEWVAAFEAAGEEILTMKSGAVQNSPPHKVSPEPGPWSPVKRKNQEVGPFDCTKYTNTNVSPGSPN